MDDGGGRVLLDVLNDPHALETFLGLSDSKCSSPQSSDVTSSVDATRLLGDADFSSSLDGVNAVSSTTPEDALEELLRGASSDHVDLGPHSHPFQISPTTPASTPPVNNHRHMRSPAPPPQTSPSPYPSPSPSAPSPYHRLPSPAIPSPSTQNGPMPSPCPAPSPIPAQAQSQQRPQKLQQNHHHQQQQQLQPQHHLNDQHNQHSQQHVSLPHAAPILSIAQPILATAGQPAIFGSTLRAQLMTVPRMIQPKQPQILPKIQGSSKAARTSSPGPSAAKVTSAPTPIIVNQQMVLSQPVLIQTPTGGMQFVLRPAAPQVSQAGQLLTLPLQGQPAASLQLGAPKTTDQPQMMLPGTTTALAASSQGQALIIPQLMNQPVRSSLPLIQIGGTTMQLQQIQTPNGIMTVAIPAPSQTLNLQSAAAVRPAVTRTSASVATSSVNHHVQNSISISLPVFHNNSGSVDAAAMGSQSKHRPPVINAMLANGEALGDLDKPPPKKKAKKKKKKVEGPKPSSLLNPDELLMQAVREAGIGDDDFLEDLMPPASGPEVFRSDSLIPGSLDPSQHASLAKPPGPHSHVNAEMVGTNHLPSLTSTPILNQNSGASVSLSSAGKVIFSTPFPSQQCLVPFTCSDSVVQSQNPGIQAASIQASSRPGVSVQNMPSLAAQTPGNAVLLSQNPGKGNCPTYIAISTTSNAGSSRAVISNSTVIASSSSRTEPTMNHIFQKKNNTTYPSAKKKRPICPASSGETQAPEPAVTLMAAQPQVSQTLHIQPFLANTLTSPVTNPVTLKQHASPNVVVQPDGALLPCSRKFTASSSFPAHTLKLSPSIALPRNPHFTEASPNPYQQPVLIQTTSPSSSVSVSNGQPASGVVVHSGGQLVLQPGQRVQAIQLSEEHQQNLRAVQSQILKLQQEKSLSPMQKQLLEKLIAAQNRILAQGRPVDPRDSKVSWAIPTIPRPQAQGVALPSCEESVSPPNKGSSRSSLPTPSNITANKHLANLLKQPCVSVSTNSAPVRYLHQVGPQIIALTPQQKQSTGKVGQSIGSGPASVMGETAKVTLLQKIAPAPSPATSPPATSASTAAPGATIYNLAQSSGTTTLTTQVQVQVQVTGNGSKDQSGMLLSPHLQSQCQAQVQPQAQTPCQGTRSISTSTPAHAQAQQMIISGVARQIPAILLSPVVATSSPVVTTQTESVSSPAVSMALKERQLLFESQLKTDEVAAHNPDCKTPWRSKEDMVKRLMPYHVFYEPLPSSEMLQLEKDGFEDRCQYLMNKMRYMLNKYQYLLLKDSMREVPSAEQVMLERTFYSEEKTRLLQDRELVKRGESLSLPLPPDHWDLDLPHLRTSLESEANLATSPQPVIKPCSVVMSDVLKSDLPLVNPKVSRSNKGGVDHYESLPILNGLARNHKVEAAPTPTCNGEPDPALDAAVRSILL